MSESTGFQAGVLSIQALQGRGRGLCRLRHMLIIGRGRFIGVHRRCAVRLCGGHFGLAVAIAYAVVRHQALDHSGQRLDEHAQVVQFGTEFTDLPKLLCHGFKLRREDSVHWRAGAV